MSIPQIASEVVTDIHKGAFAHAAVTWPSASTSSNSSKSVAKWLRTGDASNASDEHAMLLLQALAAAEYAAGVDTSIVSMCHVLHDPPRGSL